MARSVHKLSIPSATRYLEKARRFVETYAREADLTEDSVQQFKIAVDEACTNIIKHAYKGKDTFNIELAIIVDPKCFTVRIRDEGQSFEPHQYHQPDIFKLARDRRKGGFGVHIMRQLMDRVEYRTRGNVNEVRLTKYRNHGQVDNDVMSS